MRKVIIFFWVLCIARFAYSAREAIIIGGGCEDRFSTNKFIPIMEKLEEGFKKNDWKTTILSGAWGAKNKLTKKNLLEVLDKALADKSFRIGSQLFLSINSHGLPNTSGGSHQICLGFDDNERPILLSLGDPDLTSRLARLKQKGIKLGFSDMSCFGGQTARDLASFGCVVTSQGSDLSANTYGVSGALSEALNSSDGIKNYSMESLYVDTLLKGHTYQIKDNKFPPMPQTPNFSALIDDQKDLALLSIFPEERDFKTDFSLSCNILDDYLKEIDELYSDVTNITAFNELISSLRRRIIKQKNTQSRFQELSKQEMEMNQFLFQKFSLDIIVPDELQKFPDLYLEILSMNYIQFVAQGIKDGKVKVIFNLGQINNLTPDTELIKEYLQKFSENELKEVDLSKAANNIAANFVISINDYKARSVHQMLEAGKAQARLAEIALEINKIQEKNPYITDGYDPDEIGKQGLRI